MTKRGHLVVPRDDRLAIRIIGHAVFFIAVAGITHCEVGAGLFCNQHRKLVIDFITARYHISSRVRTNSKFADRQRIMMIQHTILQQLFVFRFLFEVTAGVFGNHAIPKLQLQIVILHTAQKRLRYMQNAFCSGQLRRGEHFPNRNVDVRHAVFEIRFLRRVVERMEHDLHIGVVVAAPLDLHPRCLIQRIDQVLLNRLVGLVIQRIDL